MSVAKFLSDLGTLNTKQGTIQDLIDEAVEKNERLVAMIDSYRQAKVKRDGEIAVRESRMAACTEIRAELEVLLPRIEALDAKRGDVVWDLTNAPAEVIRWKALVDDFNRLYYARGVRTTTPMKWED